MDKKFITFHIIRDIPWSNLNRDDSGTPKRTILGGVERGLLSSQSIKRAIRKDYEARILEIFPEDSISLPHTKAEVSTSGSLRTRNTIQYITERVKQILTDGDYSDQFNEKKVTKEVDKILKKLTGNGKDVVALFSIEELETLSAVLAQKAKSESEDKKDESEVQLVIEKNKTGALAIAAFGRMFANSQDKQTDASVAVSPAISTHSNIIETDYFIAGDDFQLNTSGSGAAHLDTALYTSGVFYHSVTIDVKELASNWTGITGEAAEAHLSQLVRSIIRSLPTGKKNSTAPYTEPTLIIAEQQGYREAYSISEPVLMSQDGGFIEPTLELFSRQFDLMRKVSDSNYGDAAIAGMRGEDFSSKSSLSPESVTEDNLVSKVTEWLLDKSEPALSAENDHQLDNVDSEI